ncbi:hypothetical protein ACI65C_004386 [Semiaphis heraclei]
MSLVEKPHINDYWSTNPVLYTPFASIFFQCFIFPITVNMSAKVNQAMIFYFKSDLMQTS